MKNNVNLGYFLCYSRELFDGSIDLGIAKNKKHSLEVFYIKNTPTQVFSYEYCEIFKSTSFEEHLQTAEKCSPNKTFNHHYHWFLHSWRTF